MLRKIARVIALVFLLMGVFPISAHAHNQEVTISVGRDGFEHMANYTIEVEAGHQVTITFNYADGDLSVNDPHEIQILGSGIELPTVRIDRDHPTGTITFTPTQTGTLTFLCILPCMGMGSLSGSIQVIRPKGTAPSASLALELSPRGDESVLAQAKLTDASGSPIGAAPVAFFMHTAVGGELDLGAPVTMEDGSVVLTIPAKAGQKVQVRAVFQSSDGLSYAENWAEITMPGEPVTNPLGALSTPTPPPVLALILIIVLGGIWTTYGTVVYQILRIRKG